jgi:SAM-dependent methyltransferase
MAAGPALAQTCMAAAAARARPAVLRHAGAVLAMTAAFDPATPNIARVYDHWLGGKDNYAADRAEADRLVKLYPPLPALARENRAFLIKAVTWAARQGIGQFIDLGAGLPTSTSLPVHQAARAVLPAARIAYVDTDPVVVTHARALLATDDGIAAVEADLTDPVAVLCARQTREVIDPAQPVCVILGAVLHFCDADAARQVTAGYRDLVAPGSCLVLSVARYDDQTLAGQLADEYHAARFVNHPAEDIASFFTGWQLTGPGATEARIWRPDATVSVRASRTGHIMAGVAMRPED